MRKRHQSLVAERISDDYYGEVADGFCFVDRRHTQRILLLVHHLSDIQGSVFLSVGDEVEQAQVAGYIRSHLPVIISNHRKDQGQDGIEFNGKPFQKSMYKKVKFLPQSMTSKQINPR